MSKSNMQYIPHIKKLELELGLVEAEGRRTWGFEGGVSWSLEEMKDSELKAERVIDPDGELLRRVYRHYFDLDSRSSRE
jgi:hypothetical protein